MDKYFSGSAYWYWGDTDDAISAVIIDRVWLISFNKVPNLRWLKLGIVNPALVVKEQI